MSSRLILSVVLALNFSALAAPGQAADSSSKAEQTRAAHSGAPSRQQVQPPPADGLVDAGSFQKAPSPGSLASWFGPFGVATSAANTIPLPTTLSGLSLTMGSGGRAFPVPLLFVSANQINIQVPWELAGETQVEAVFTIAGEVTPPVTVALEAASPALFTFGGGSGPAAAVGPTGVIAQRHDFLPGVTSNPIRAGEAIIFFANGLGGVDTPVGTGTSAALDGGTLRRTVQTARLYIGGVEQQVLFAGLSPEFVGLYQINAIVADDTPSGALVDVVLGIGSVTSQDGVSVAVEGPDPLPLKDETVGELSAVTVDPPQPAGGSTATLTIRDPAATAISAVAVGAGCGGFATHAAAGGELVVAQPVGEFGVCDVSAEITTAGEVRPASTRFVVEPVALELPAVRVRDALFVPGELPNPRGTLAAVAIASVDRPGSLINGGTAQLRVRPASPAALSNVSQILVGVQGAGGAEGHYEVIPQVQDGVLAFELTLLDVPAAAALERQQNSQIAILIQLLDLQGSLGEVFPLQFGTEAVGSGTVQVSLSWDTATDVDLHLVEPTGQEIYWASPSSSSQGSLDLDSNAGCGIDGVNNENTTWPMGVVPPLGEYIVRVDFWSDCDTAGANATITTTVCGVTNTFTQAFAENSDTRGGAGAGVEITRFTFEGCSFRVRGTAAYEDFAQTTGGLSASATELPIRFAKVEVRRATDDQPIAAGSTDQAGKFDLAFENPGPDGYYVLVIAEQDDIALKQKVQNAGGDVYSVRSDTVDVAMEPDKSDLRIVAPAATAGPAFNIFDMGLVGGALIRGAIGSVPPFLTWEWTVGQQGSCGSDVSCFRRSVGNYISVLSIPRDPDEYDDLVLLHEYGHYWQHNFGRSNSPGGPHSFSSQVAPALAWGEGSATFFGNLAKGSSLYLDTTSSGIGARLNIETLGARVPLGTSNMMQTGMLSEAVVAAVLWDLADRTNENKDTVSNRIAVLAANSWLRKPPTGDRGPAGVDLTDFLDGWFCNGNSDRGNATSGVEGNVIGIHQFNYDFAHQSACPPAAP